MQIDFLQQRSTLRGIVDELLNDHAALIAASEAKSNRDQEIGNGTSTVRANDHSGTTPSAGHEHASDGRQMNGAKNSQEPGIRKGVRPGSFIDLLVRGSMKGTGQNFTSNQKAQQVSLWLTVLTSPKILFSQLLTLYQDASASV